jgi:CubicO group peptidase (beta-lactamase class C family)
VQSVTKSVISALVGIALEDGCIKSLDDPIWDYLPGRTPAENDPLKREISLEHLLTMSSGFEWIDGQTPIWTSADWIQFVLDQPMASPPGTVWNYNSGNAHLLSAIIQNACGQNTLEVAREKLFTPLGITEFTWETDPQGIPNGGWGLSMLPRDMAKIGLLYLNDGVWDGQQILPAEWITASTQRYFQVPKPLEPWDLYYGYTWWLHGDGSYYAAHGRGGQFIYVLPEQGMVVVFTRDVNTPDDEFIGPQQLIREHIVPAVK